MIISASRRTDIPAFYPKWFVNRLKEGLFLVANPFNPRQVSQIVFSPDLVECIVFWTKNPKAVMDHLKEIDALGYRYYFQFTLTAYDRQIEKKLPPKDIIIQSFKRLSEKIGRERVIWRYDPVLMTDTIDYSYHVEQFAFLANALRGYTNKCITSFIDMYKKCEKNMRSISIVNINDQEKRSLLEELKEITCDAGMTLETCAEDMTYSELGISPAKCIDDVLISCILGTDITGDKDPAQRKKCRCVESIDIGAYNTCRHHCLYCYANHSQDSVMKNIKRHEVHSALLVGNITGTKKISPRKIISHRKKQQTLL